MTSTSLTPASSIVTVHDSFEAKSESGSSVYVVGPPLTVAVCVPDAAHEIVCHAPLTVTGSLKAMLMLLFAATSDAPFAGVVDATVGAGSATTPQMFKLSIACGRGLGAPTAKSAMLLSVSVQPPALRNAAVVFDG